MTEIEFLKVIDGPTLTTVDRALALLWFVTSTRDSGIEVSAICGYIEKSGHPSQNKSRLALKLASDKKRVVKVPGTKALRLHPHAMPDFDRLYQQFAKAKPKIAASDSVLPVSLFAGTRGYIEKTVFQINASFDFALFDCCAVMCRRLLETLIIEVYETAARADEIKNKDGNFYMLSDLVRILLNDAKFNLGRNAQQGLKDFKKLGDLSAHSRRYNAREPDIDSVAHGLRVASEELLHMARLI